jgi:hypothetical protein
MPLLGPMLWDNSNEKSLAYKMRMKRSKRIRQMIEAVYSINGRCSIVDLGGTEAYWNLIGCDYLKSRNTSITLVNIDKSVRKTNVHDLFYFLQRDATSLKDITDRQFDICHSNSLIEHVGPWQKKKNLAREISRVARSYYVQTPNYWFPIEPHFLYVGFQFLPKPIRVSLIMRRNLGWMPKATNISEAVESVENCSLLTFKEFSALFPKATIEKEKILGLTKSFTAIGGDSL